MNQHPNITSAVDKIELHMKIPQTFKDQLKFSDLNHTITILLNPYKNQLKLNNAMSNPTENPAYQYLLDPDLTSIDWQRVLHLFKEINWKYRVADEIEKAFKLSTNTIFVYHDGEIIAFGRTIGDGQYYAMLADIVVDPAYQGQGLGKYLVTTLNNQLTNYHFVNLSAAPGADNFYKSMGWKKQTTAFIWPQGPKQLRQHCEKDDV